MSADEHTVIIASPYIDLFYDDDFDYYNDAVRVYSYSGDTGSWEQEGEDINDEKTVSLSADGSTVAIGSRFTPPDDEKKSALVRVYSYDDDTDGWEQKGRDMK